MHSFNVLSVVMLSVDILSVMMLSVVVSSVVIVVVTAPQQLQQWPPALFAK